MLPRHSGQIKEGGCCGPCAPEVAYQQMILKTTQTSQHTTQFSWSAFRYVQISSLPPGWQINVTAIPLMTDLKWTSSFKSSNSRLDDIYELCRNTHASNMMGIQSDCPHRERFGYTGDTLATLPTSLAFFDGTAFYEKRLYDVQDSLRVNGGVTVRNSLLRRAKSTIPNFLTVTLIKLISSGDGSLRGNCFKWFW
jgi:alpha-L-rhamnosidase